MKTSKKITGTPLLLLIICFTLVTTSSTSSTKHSAEQATGCVTLCHNGRSVKVNVAFVDYHLRHGDRMGSCLISE